MESYIIDSAWELFKELLQDDGYSNPTKEGLKTIAGLAFDAVEAFEEELEERENATSSEGCF